MPDILHGFVLYLAILSFLFAISVAIYAHTKDRNPATAFTVSFTVIFVAGLLWLQFGGRS